MTIASRRPTLPNGLASFAPGMILGKSAIPFILAATGTMANNGAITLGTALPVIYPSAYVFLPAGAIAAGVPAASAWYYCTFSSTTVGTVFNNTYTGPGMPSIPAAPTAFVTTGPGAFAGITAASDAVSVTLPANSLGANGQMEIEANYSATNNANAKSSRFQIGGTSFATPSLASLTRGSVRHTFANTGVAAKNKDPLALTDLTNVGSTGTAPQLFTKDTTADLTVAIGGAHGTATDNLVLESWQITLWSDNT